MATSRVLPTTSNPYGGGAVIFDSSPATQYFINKKAREEANKNAFIKGFQDIGNNINAAGLDNNDVQDLYNKKAAWQQYVMGHQKEYQNPSLDNGKTYAEANRLYNDAAQHISAAKKKVENLKEFEKISLDPNKRDLLNESYHQKLEDARLPILSPKYKPIDFTDIYNPKPFDEAKYRASITPLIKDEVTYGVPEKTNQQFYYQTPKITTPKYDLGQIERHAENAYTQNPTYARLINKIDPESEQFKQLNDIYKKSYGRQLDIKHPEQLAIAHTLSLLPQTKKELGEPKINTVDWEQEKNKRNFGQSIIKIEANQGQGKTMQELGIRDVFGEVNDAVGAGKAKPLNELSSTAQGVILKYARDITGEKLGQGEIAIFRGNDNKIGIWSVKRQKNKSGVEEDVVDKLIAPIDFTDINVPTQAGVKEKRAVIQSGNKEVPSSKPSAPKKELSLAERMKQAKKGK